MSTARATLWQRLVDAGVANGELPSTEASHGPWYIRAMLGIAGWFGALFLLGFVAAALAFVFRNESAAVAVGLMCCVAAYAIFRVARHNDFLAQFGLALSFAGQVLFAYGVSKAFHADTDTVGLALLIAAFEALLAFALVNAVHRAWSTLAAAVALSYALATLGLSGMVGALVAAGVAAVWLRESLWAERGDLWRPVGYGLALSLVNVELISVFGRGMSLFERALPTPALPLWVGPLLTGVPTMYLIYRLLQRHGVAAASRTGVLTLGAAVAVIVVARDAPGVTAALLVLILGYATGGRVLLGIGVVALLAWLSHYYYALQLTLLAKSGVLAATGSVLIALWFGIRRWFAQPAPAEARDA